MKKLILALAMVGTLGGAGLATSASAAPGTPMGVSVPETVTPVRMHRAEHRMMHRRMHRRHHMRMHRNHMRHRSMHHRGMHRM